MDCDAVAEIVSLSGGRLVGRTRLQKSVYLLKVCGIDLGFDFDYHHYGPFSEELANAAQDAEALDLINVEWKSNYGNDYAIFTSTVDAEDFPQVEKAKRILEILKHHDATVLELAATADFLSKNGYGADAWEETKRRKAVKATAQRLDASTRLLQELRSIQ